MDERVKQFLDHPWTVPAGVGVLSLCAGFGIGYIVGKRQKVEHHVLPEQLAMHFDVNDLAEIQEMTNETNEEDYNDFDIDVKDEEDEIIFMTEDEFIAKQLKDAMIESEVKLAPEPEIENIFAEDTDDWDYKEELKHRSSSAPYVLHKDEFWAEELDYSQITLTYYEGDDIMADEDDTPVYNYLQVTGDLKFGHGSGDPNVVHIRNDYLRTEYEVIRDPGLFSEEVLGLEIEENQRARDLKHSNTRKFKLE